MSKYQLKEPICNECLLRQLPDIPITELATNLLSNKPNRRGCPFCGTNSAQAIEDGLVGCPLCYEALENSVWRHFGITPGSWTKTPAG